MDDLRNEKAKGVKNVAAIVIITYEHSFNKQNDEALHFHD